MLYSTDPPVIGYHKTVRLAVTSTPASLQCRLAHHSTTYRALLRARAQGLCPRVEASWRYSECNISLNPSPEYLCFGAAT